MALCLCSTALHMGTHMVGIGTEAHSARQKVFEEHQHAFDAGQLCLPTFSIVKSWMSDNNDTTTHHKVLNMLC